MIQQPKRLFDYGRSCLRCTGSPDSNLACADTRRGAKFIPKLQIAASLKFFLAMHMRSTILTRRCARWVIFPYADSFLPNARGFNTS